MQISQTKKQASLAVTVLTLVIVTLFVIYKDEKSDNQLINHDDTGFKEVATNSIPTLDNVSHDSIKAIPQDTIPVENNTNQESE